MTLTAQQIVEMIFQFLAGLGVFLFGVRTLSDNMEKLANRRLKALFRKTAGSKRRLPHWCKARV